MPTHRTPRLSDHKALQEAHAALKDKLAEAERQRDDARHEAEELRAKLAAATNIVKEANARADAAAKTVMERATAALATAADERDGPSADEARWIYGAADPTEDRLCANKAEADALKAEQPGYWFDRPSGAQKAYAAATHAPLADGE